MVCFENFREHEFLWIVNIEKFRRHKLGKGKKKKRKFLSVKVSVTLQKLIQIIVCFLIIVILKCIIKNSLLEYHMSLFN